MFGAQRSHGAPRGQTWLPVSEPLVLNWVFDFPEEKPETGPVPAKPSCLSSQQDPIEGLAALLRVGISGCRSEPSECAEAGGRTDASLPDRDKDSQRPL